MSPFAVFASAERSWIDPTLIAFVSLRCVVHHKKTHLHGIVVIAFAIRYMVHRPVANVDYASSYNVVAVDHGNRE